MSSSWKHNDIQSVSSRFDSKLIFLLEMSAEENHFTETRSCFIRPTEADPRAASSHKQKEADVNRILIMHLNLGRKKQQQFPPVQTLKSGHSLWSLTET